MATLNKVNTFTKNMAEKVHNFASDQLMVALVASANAPVATNTQLTNLTEISYTNCSSRVITTSSSSQTSGTYKLVLADLVLTASGGSVGPFRYVVLYNNTATNKELIGWYDYGSDVTLASGETFTIDFDNTNGVFQAA
jgi:hypothetical protein